MLNALETTEPAVEQEQFKIDTQERAAWAMRKLRKIRLQQAENSGTAKSLIDKLQAEIDQIKAWEADENAKLDRDAEYFVCGLEMYHRKHIETNPKLKTIKLPFGETKIRAQKPDFQCDNKALLVWAKVNRKDCVKTEESPNWAKIKESVVVKNGQAVDTTTGAIIDGVTVVEREPKFEVVVQLEGV